jgi:ABC-type multidrug transport system ATPase subunit
MTSGFSISVKNLNKRFNREWIFRNLNYEFTSGNCYAITGPNGSGKSTLIQVLSGFTPPSEGEIAYSFHGKNVSVEDIYKHTAIAAPYMELIEEFTLEEQLRFHLKMRSSRNNIGIEQLIGLMYLNEAKTKLIRNFSSGMKQRLKLGIAFHTESDLLILDEPGTNLDSRAFEWYKTQLSNVPKNVILVIASNNPEEYSEAAHILNMQDYKVKK